MTFQTRSRFGPGMVVRVKSPAEIAATLDEQGTLSGLPFMPEMMRFCGQQYRIANRVAATCVLGSGMRRFEPSDVVTLEGVRCDGRLHEGCEVACLIFWKEAWLAPGSPDPSLPTGDNGALLAAKLKSVKEDGKFFCQSTELCGATKPVRFLRKCFLIIRHLLAGRTPVRGFVRFCGPELFWRIATPAYRLAKNAKGLVLGNRPRDTSRGKRSKATPLGLQPGDWVQVKAKEEILPTLDANCKSGGLSFTVDMVPYCRGRYRVQAPVHKAIKETDAEMVHIRKTVILEKVTCQGFMCFGVCPREHYLWWRESWLHKAVPGKQHVEAREARG